MKTRKAYLTQPRHFEIREEEIFPSDDQVMVRVASCGLCNWELNHWKGYLKNGDYPFQLGHEVAGTVAEVGKNVRGFAVGDRVACLCGMVGFADYVLCHFSAVQKLQEDIDPRYVLGEPLKCIVTVLSAAAPRPGDYGVVHGCGPMGQWCVHGLAGQQLAGLIAVDIDEEKLALARQFGATATVNSAKENLSVRLAELTGGHLADFVIDGTGVPALVNTAMDCLTPAGKGRLVMMSSHEEISREVDFRKAVERGVSILFAHPPYSTNEREDFRRAVLLLNNGTFRVKPLISHEFGLSEINKAFETLEHKPAGYRKGLVYPD